MPSARTIKARNGKCYKSNAESIRSRKRDNYQNNPQIKRMPRERGTTLTLTKKRQPLVSNIIIILEPQKAASHDQYRTHSETIKEHARKQYKTKLEPKRRAACKQYSAHPEPKK